MHACRNWIRQVEEEGANEIAVRQRVRTWVATYATEVLAPFGDAFDWKLPEPSQGPLDISKLRFDEKRFTLDVALALLQARIWDEPALMRSMTAARHACEEVRGKFSL